MRALVAFARPAPGERSRLALSVALSAGAVGASIALLTTSGYLISRAAQRPEILSLMVAIVAVRAFGLSRAALRYLERLVSHDLALRSLARLRSRFYARLEPLVPGGLPGRGRGELLARFVGDVETLQDVHVRVLIPALVAPCVIAGAGLAAALMLPAAGAVVVGALALTAVTAPLIAARAAASAARHQAPARARLVSELVEAVDGSAELAIAGAGAEKAQSLAVHDTLLGRLALRDARAGTLATVVSALINAAGLIVLLLVAIAGVRAGSLPGVLVAAVVFLYLGAAEAILPLEGAARRLRACAIAAERIDDVLSREPAVTDPAQPVALSAVSLADGLRVEHVSLAYPGEGRPVLSEVSLTLRPGEHVALTGESGAGKTTLAELLVRFHDPIAGRVTLGGVDLRTLAQADVRRAVLLCGQDAHVFNTTIRENLLIARRTATEEDLWDALAAVELDAWARALPDGLDTIAGQEGELVSGGQRQRLALARALLSEAPYLILDEPTAHLDGPLARRVMARVHARTRARALLVITHDTHWLEGFDRTLTLRDATLGPAAAARVC